MNLSIPPPAPAGHRRKLTAVTFGTEGDTRPIAALCRALKDAGHDVTLLAAADTLRSAEERFTHGAQSRNFHVDPPSSRRIRTDSIALGAKLRALTPILLVFLR